MKEACSKNNAKFFEINDDYEEEMKEVYSKKGLTPDKKMYTMESVV